LHQRLVRRKQNGATAAHLEAIFGCAAGALDRPTTREADRGKLARDAAVMWNVAGNIYSRTSSMQRFNTKSASFRQNHRSGMEVITA